MDLWKQCAEWLSRHNVIPRDHRVLRPDATHLEFMNLIRDGVLLCKLLNKIVPGSISMEEMSLRPQLSQLLCIRNISAFLNCCKESFDIQDEHLFEPYMLFDYSDVGKVIYMISKLSKSEKSKATKVPGFPVDYVKKKEVVAVYKSESKKEDITQSVLYDKFEFYQAMSEEYTIYDEIYEVTGQNSQLTVEKMYTEPSPKNYATVELYETEVVYLNTLDSLENIYKVHLKKVMPPDDFEFVFQNISELYSLHSDFCTDLYQHFNSQTPISDIFFKYQHKFLIYADFCVNLKHVQDRLIQACTNSHNVKKAVEFSESIKNKGKFHLVDLLTVPFQRFMKYSPLVESLISNSRKSDKDFHRLQEVNAMLQDIYVHCNEARRDKENMEAVTILENSIVNFNQVFSRSLSSYGRLLKEGRVVCRFPEEKLKGIHLLLFEQNLLFCLEEKSQSCRLTYLEGIHLVSTDIGEATLPFKNKSSFVLNYRPTRDTLRTYTITLKTTDQKRDWLELIQKAKANLVPHNYSFGKHLFTLRTFPPGSYCHICRKLLPGLLNQGYKCNKNGCGVAVHMNCITRTDQCGLKTAISMIENASGSIPSQHSNEPDYEIDDQPQEQNPTTIPSKPASVFHQIQNENNSPKSESETSPSKRMGIRVLPLIQERRPATYLDPDSDTLVLKPQAPELKQMLRDHNGSPVVSEHERIQVLPRAARAASCIDLPSSKFSPYNQNLNPPNQQEVRPFASSSKIPTDNKNALPEQEVVRPPPRLPPKPLLSQAISMPEVGSALEPLQKKTLPKFSFQEPQKKKIGVPVFSHMMPSDVKSSKDVTPDLSILKMSNLGKVLQKEVEDGPYAVSNIQMNYHPPSPSKVLPVIPFNASGPKPLSGSSTSSPTLPFEKPEVFQEFNSARKVNLDFESKLNQHLKKFQEDRSPPKVSQGKASISVKPFVKSTMPQSNTGITNMAGVNAPGDQRNGSAMQVDDISDRDEIQSRTGYELRDLDADGLEIYEAVNVKILDACIPGFVGKMDSLQAAEILNSSRNGTFLVRERQGEYAVSIRYKGSVRHVKIYTLDNGQVCFAAIKKFDTVQALINFYRQHTLNDLFNNLDTCLFQPYRV